MKDHILKLHAHLGELHDAADKLENKNFRDIVASARARLAQLSEHPDLDKVAAAFKSASEAEHGEQNAGSKSGAFPDQ